MLFVMPFVMSEKRSFRRYLRQLLLLDEPPERTARTFGFGVFISFSPFIGLHIVIAMVILLFAKLNRLSFLAGVFSNTPWTVAPMLALGTGIGAFVLGRDTTLPELSAETLASGQFWKQLTSDAWNLLAPFMLGNFILSGVLALAGYAILKWFLLRYRSKRSGDIVGAATSG